MTHHDFFCGIGGSGMLPLALILKSRGHIISGSDRSYDQGHSIDKFNKLKENSIMLYPQDGSGITKKTTRLIVSGAIEDSIPDVAAAKQAGITIHTRAEILASLFNTYKNAISIAGTSGKSTVTGMTATIFQHAGRDPTVMNGAIIENFTNHPHSPFANMRAGTSETFITETDESDGSIALYNPSVAAVNNIALDHMPIEELKAIFTNFINRAQKTAILNADDTHISSILNDITVPIKTYGIKKPADLQAQNIVNKPTGISFTINNCPVSLNVPGAHNISNALAAISIGVACDIPLQTAIEGIEAFKGIKRRLQIIGQSKGITVIDDFAHNPDKIAATLKTLKEFDGRLIIMFQPHGFSPLRLMGKEMIQSFAEHLDTNDILLMPEVYYAGGTVDRSVTAKGIINHAKNKGLNAHWFKDRDGVKEEILSKAKKGDRIIIMGARDDTLTDFAEEILGAI